MLCAAAPSGEGTGPRPFDEGPDGPGPQALLAKRGCPRLKVRSGTTAIRGEAVSTIDRTVGSTAPAETVTARTTSATVVGYAAAAARLSLGWVFLWAFLDKAFALGHDTAGSASWVNGDSPTKGFLGMAAAGPFKGLYR